MVEDPFDKKPVKKNKPKHKRPDGEESGEYFCMFCGAPLSSDENSEHGFGVCEHRPELVEELRKINGW